MATLLSLVQDLKTLTSVSGPAITTVASLTGDNARLLLWIKKAWNEIQTERRDWNFLWQEATAPAATITNVALTSNIVTVTCANLFSVGQNISLSGLTTATYLNGQTVIALTVSATGFTAAFTHANDASHADTGSATVPSPSGVILRASAQVDTYNIATLMAASGTVITLGEGPWVIEGSFGKRRLLMMHPQLFAEWRSMAWLTAGSSPPPPDVISGIPYRATLLPDRVSLRFDRIPSVDLTLEGWFFIQNQALANDGDVPIMPAKYHDAILYRALKKWAEYEEATEQLQTAMMEDNKWTNTLYQDLLPKIAVGAKALS